ncbi:unnamed protein product, partial [Calicophoron daubneyi]
MLAMIGLLVRLNKIDLGSIKQTPGHSEAVHDPSYVEAIAVAKLMIIVGILFLIPSVCLFVGLQLIGVDNTPLDPNMLCCPNG